MIRRILLASTCGMMVWYAGIAQAKLIGDETTDDTRYGRRCQTSLRALCDLTSLPILREATCAQISSFSREGGNDDRGHFVDTTGDRAVLADISGSGCICRIWSANPEGQLMVYFNQEEDPRINMPFAEFLSGEVSPFLYPICSGPERSGGGHNSFYPLPFRNGCRIEVASPGSLYYQVAYQSFPDDFGVVTYDPKEINRQLLDQTLADLRNPQPPTGQIPTLETRTSGSLRPGGRRTLASLRGAGVITALRLKIDVPDWTDCRLLTLKMFWDKESEPSVLAPVSDFFGTPFSRAEFASVPLGYRDGRHYCFFPMPFGRRAKIIIESDLEIPVLLESHIDYHRVGVPVDYLGRFHAQWRKAKTVLGAPYSVADIRGRGHYVGTILNVSGRGGLGFLEGDEQIFRDGETVPSIHGTGTEDYFSGGWYFTDGPFSLPFHGCLVKGEGRSRISAYRFHVTDCIPFNSRLLVNIEHGGRNDAPGNDYSSVGFWYQVEPHSPFPPMLVE